MRAGAGRTPAVDGRPIPRDAVLLVVALFLVVAATNILTPLLPDVRDELRISIATAGWVVGAFGLARLVLDLPAGVLIDRVGHRRLSLVALGVLVVSSLAGLWAPTLELLLAARIGSGAAVAILATVILAATAATATAANRGAVLALVPTANNASTAVYPLVGGILGETLGWRATFGLSAILALVGGAILLPLLLRIELPRRRAAAAPTGLDPGVLHGRRRVVAIAATNLGVVATTVHRHGFRNTVLPLFAATALALNGLTIAAAITLMSIIAISVSLPGGMLGDRVGRRRVIVTGLVIVALTDLAFLLSRDPLSFLALAALVGLGDFYPSSQTAMLSDIVPPEDRTRVLSGYRFSVDLGAFIGPVATAAIMDATSAPVAVAAVAGLLLVAALVARITLPGSRPPGREPVAAGASPR